MGETQKERLAELNSLYVFIHSAGWTEIMKSMLENHREVAVRKRCEMDAKPQDPNLTIINWIKDFFENIDSLLIEQEELESELKKDSEKEES